MQPREIFEIWAPEGSVWSPWAKPVLFAQMDSENLSIPLSSQTDYGVNWSPHASERTALIINLPAVSSVEAGLSLAQSGYRPVPLYNTSMGQKAVIDLTGMVTRLASGTSILQGIFLDEQAPPAFLIDSERLRGALPPTPGMYDNRWVVWPQDFPSSNFLRSKEIERVMVVQNGTNVQDDLAHVLTRWKREKLEVLIQDLASRGAIQSDVSEDMPPIAGVGRIVPFQVSAFFAFWMWSRMMFPARLGLRRSSVGGFGGIVPFPSSSG